MRPTTSLVIVANKEGGRWAAHAVLNSHGKARAHGETYAAAVRNVLERVEALEQSGEQSD